MQGFKGAKVTREGARVKSCKDLKVPRVTRVLRLKSLLKDRVLSRTHLSSSLTPEEGPYCSMLFYSEKFTGWWWWVGGIETRTVVLIVAVKGCCLIVF